MSTPHPSAADLKKQLLGIAGAEKREDLTQQAASRFPTPMETLAPEVFERYGVDPASIQPNPAALQLRRRQEAIDQSEARQASHWVSPWEEGTLLGNTKQSIAQFIEGAPRTLSHYASLPFDAVQATRMSGMDPDALDLYNQEQRHQREQDFINQARTSAFTDLLLGRIDKDTYAQRVDNAPNEVLQRLQTHHQNPGYQLAEPLSEEQAAFLDALVGQRQGLIARDLPSHRSQLEVIQGARDRGEAIRLWGLENPATTSGIANPDRIDNVIREVPEVLESSGASRNYAKAGEAWDKEDYGTASAEVFKGTMRAAWPMVKMLSDNPGAVSDVVFREVLPEVALGLPRGIGKFLLAASSAGYSGQLYNEGITHYRELHGTDPSKRELAEMATWSAVAGGMNYAGNIAILSPVKQLPLSRKVGDAFDGVQEKINSSTAGSLLAGQARVGLSTARAGIAEGVTEGAQTAIEENLSKLNTDFDAADIWGGAALGMAGGGAMGGVLSSVRETGRALSTLSDAAASGAARAQERVTERQNKRQAAEAETARKQSTFDEAVETGDVSAFLDPESPDYNPEQAVAALTKRASEKELSADEKLDLRQQVGQTVAALEEQGETLKAELASLTPEEGERSYAERLQILETTLENLEADDPRRARQEEIHQATQDTMDRMAELESEIEVVQGQIKRAQQAEAVLEGQNAPSPDEVAALVEATKAPEAEITDSSGVLTASPEAERLTTLAMLDPDAFDDSTLDRLVNDSSHRLTTGQREVFRQLSAQRRAWNLAKGTSQVSQDVLYGNQKEGFRGLSEYTADMARFMRRGDRRSAERHLSQLSDFRESHTNKQSALRQAMAQRGEGEVYVVRNPESLDWTVQETYPEGQNHRDAGDLRIEAGRKGTNEGNKLLKAINAEKQAIQATYDSLSTQFNTRFNTEASGAQNAEVTPQAETVPTETPQTQETPVADTGPDVDSQPAETSIDEEVDQSALDEYFQDNGQEPSPSLDDQLAQELSRLSQEPPTAEAERQRQAEAEEEAQTETQHIGLTNDQLTELGLEPALTPGMNNPEVQAGNDPQTAEQYKDLNFIQSWFKQRVDGTRPLATVKDFFDQWSENATLVEHFAPVVQGKREFSPTQRAYLGDLQAFVKSFRPKVTANLTMTNWHPRARHNDYLANFAPLEEGSKVRDGSIIPQEWRDAILVSAYVGITDLANSGDTNTESDIRAILGLDKDEVIPREAYRELGTGQRRDFIAQELGRTAFDFIGLGMVNSPHIPRNARTQMEQALGAHALQVLLQAGYVSERAVDFASLHAPNTAVIGQEVEATAEAFRGQIPWIDLAPKPRIMRSADLRKGTHQIIEKVFGTKPRLTGPTLEPDTNISERINRTDRTVSSRQREILEQDASRPRGVNTGLATVAGKFDEDLMLTMAGYVELEEGPIVTLAYNRDSQHARNEGTKREWGYLQELFSQLRDEGEHGLDSPIYFKGAVWAPQRVGLASNTVNPQASKLHRAFLHFKEWEVTFDVHQDMELANNFRLAVAQGLGLKVDKLHPETTLAQLDALVSSPNVNKMLEAINASDKGEPLSREMQEVIAEWVGERGEGAHSLQALYELARFQEASHPEAESSNFTTHYVYEADGLTNGPALTHVLMGLVNSAMGQMFGFFTEGSGLNSFADAKAQPGFTDLYEKLTKTLSGLLNHQRAADPQLFRALNEFTGALTTESGDVTKAGRDLAKPIVTPTGFGASPSKVIDAAADNFVAAFHDQIQKVLNDRKQYKGDRDQLLEVRRLVNIWNRDILQGRNPVTTPSSVNQALHVQLNDGQVAAAKARFKDAMGDAIETALQEEFGGFFNMGREINGAAESLFKAYDAVYQQVRQQHIESLITNGLMPVNAKGAPVRDLTVAEEQAIDQQLDAILPRIHTAFSRESGDINSGQDLYKTVPQMAPEGNIPYRSQVNVGPGQTMSVRGKLHERTAPGVRAVPLWVHSFDSYIASMAYETFHALNVHDGIGFGLKDMQAGAQKLNQTTFQALAKFSPMLEMLDAMDRSLQGLEALAKNSPELFQDKALQATREALAAERNEFAQRAIAAEWRKLTYLESVETVDQYVAPGGAFKVTETDRTLVQEQLKALVQRAKQEGVELASEPVAVVSEPQPTESAWGPVGTATAASDTALVRALKSKVDADGYVPVSKMVSALRQSINSSNESPRMKAFQSRLLNAVAKGLHERGTQIRYITPTTQNTDNPKLPRARGWYTLGTDYVGIKSPEFVHSAVTPETVVHELTHALVAETLEALPDDSPIVQELTQILEQARQYVTENKITGFAPAVGRRMKGGEWPPVTRDALQELVAWGMTNPAFQRQVLQKIEFHSQNRGLLNGFKAFIQNLLEIVFGKSNPTDETALASLIVNVGALFNNVQASSVHNTAKTLASADPIDSLTPHQSYEALGRSNGVTDPTYDAHLRSVLSGVVTTVFGSEGPVPALAEAQAAMTPDDVYLNALASGQMPFASRATGVLGLNAQEAFVLESVELAVKEALEGSQVTHTELRKLFAEAKRQLKPQDFYEGDWGQATQNDRDHAKAIHDFLFTREANEDGTSDFLSRFVAAGMAYQPLHNKLQTLRPRAATEASPETFAQHLVNWFNKAMRALSEWMTNTHEGQTGYEKLTALTNKLAQLHAKRKAGIKAEGFSVEGTFNEAIQKGVGALREGLLDVAQSDLVQNSTNSLVKAGRTTAKIVGGRITGDVLESLKKQRDAYTDEKLGMVAQLVQDIRGLKPALNVWNAFLRTAKRFEGRRKEVIEGHAKLVRDLLPKLSKAESSAVTRLMKLDLEVLLEEFGAEGIQSLLRDDKRVGTEIRSLHQQLPKALRDDYVIHSTMLGRQMATGEWHIPNGFENAYLMARLEGFADTSHLSEAELNRIEGILDRLASLEGILATSRITRDAAAEMMTDTAKAEGVASVLKLYRSLKEDALEKNFNGHKALMRKGYTKDIMNHRVKLMLATEKEGKALERAGFSKGMALPKDPTDANREQLYMYKLDGMGLNSRVTGIFSNTGEAPRGNTMNSGVWDADNDRVNTYNYLELQTANRRALQAYQQLKSSPGFDPRKHAKKYRKAVRNENGAVANYSYVMSENVRDDLMERDTSVDKVVGALAGSIFDKAETKTHNRNTVDALLEQFHADMGNMAEGTEAYIEFGPNNQDPEIAENYRLLPEDTKRYIKEKWGTQHMLVRNDLYQMLFGYRKYSIAETLGQDAAQQGAVRETMTKLLAWSFSDKDIPVEDMSEYKAARLLRAQLRLRQGEDIWQAIAYMIKDNWVIKNFFTSWSNELANNTELWALGISPQDIVRNKVIAFKGIITYQRDKDRLNELEWRLEADLVGPDKAAAEQEIIELRDAMQRNPVAFMIEEGLFQTIVEDVAQEMDPYAYQNRLVQWTEDKVDKHVPHWAKKVGKTVFMTHDTPIYKIMNRFPSYSDFTARYTVYQHFTQKKGMEHAKAIQLAEDAFVNYDRPQHKGLQYVNDMGILPFTKYYIRIQRVLFHIMEENPARMLSLVLASNMFPTLPFITDSFFWNKLEYSPLREGVFEWPGSIGEIATVKAGLNVLQ